MKLAGNSERFKYRTSSISYQIGLFDVELLALERHIFSIDL